MSEKAKFDYVILKRLFHYLRTHAAISWMSLIVVVSIALMSVLQPTLIGQIVDRFIEDNNCEPSAFQNFMYYFQPSRALGDQLMAWTIVVLILLIFEGILTFFSTYLGALLGQSIIKDSINNFSKLFVLGFLFAFNRIS